MKLNWDDDKNLENIEKHNISFVEAAYIWRRPNAIVVEDDARGYGEDRNLAWGTLANGKVIVVVHTYRGAAIRIISARYAEPKERKRYYEKIHQSKR